MNKVPAYSAPSDEATKKATEESINESKQFFKVETEVDEDGNTVPKAKGVVGNMSDLMADSKIW